MNGRRLFVLAFTVLGLWCLVNGTSRAIEGLQAHGWPKVKGRIVTIKVDELRTSHRIRVARLCLDLDYLYMVDEVIYEGHRLGSGWACYGSEERARGILARYKAGDEVQVYYDPARPERSMLEPGLNWTVFFLWGVAAIVLSLCLPLLRGKRRGGSP